MQVRIVDAVIVRKLKQRAVKDAHQNCRDAQIRGAVVKEALQALGLWEDENVSVDNISNTLGDAGNPDTVCSHDCVSGSRQSREGTL